MDHPQRSQSPLWDVNQTHRLQGKVWFLTASHSQGSLLGKRDHLDVKAVTIVSFWFSINSMGINLRRNVVKLHESNGFVETPSCLPWRVHCRLELQRAVRTRASAGRPDGAQVMCSTGLCHVFNTLTSTNRTAKKVGGEADFHKESGRSKPIFYLRVESFPLSLSCAKTCQSKPPTSRHSFGHCFQHLL